MMTRMNLRAGLVAIPAGLQAEVHPQLEVLGFGCRVAGPRLPIAEFRAPS